MTLRIDGAITKNDDTFLEKHLENCGVCSRELALRERFSCALRELGGEEMKAPPEFCGAVMSKLRSERRVSLMWLPVAWRKTIAAAAAILLLAGGSAGVTAGLKLAGGGKIIATNSVQTTGVDTGDNFVPTPGDSAQGGEGAGGTEAGSAGNTGTDDPGGKDITAVNSEVLSENKTGGSITASQTALLSSGLKVTGTILKSAVDDLGEARAKAVALAAGAGASTQVFPEQYGGRNIVVIRFAVPSDSAPDLIAGLSGIGKLFDRTDESRDITSLYNETLVQYLDLQSRISSTQNAEERSQMESQAASYKVQLDAWDTEAGKQIVTLWLECN
jgi:hypothetical protein